MWTVEKMPDRPWEAKVEEEMRGLITRAIVSLRGLRSLWCVYYPICDSYQLYLRECIFAGGRSVLTTRSSLNQLS